MVPNLRWRVDLCDCYCHLMAVKIKVALNPQNVYNPTRFINIERMGQAVSRVIWR